jgi:predicted metal-dependent TIM-barrel fold hydrolase
MSFLSYTIKWIGSNMAMPFWIVGHIHLSTNVYEDIYEILASFGMNIIVALAFWLEWKEYKNTKSIDNR